MTMQKASSAATATGDRIYLSPPHMSDAELEMLTAAFRSNWIAPLGPEVDAFERQFAEKVGVNHAVAVSSGTAALHLSLLAAGVKPGDEVVVSTLTFVASVNAIRYCGASPVLIDSDLASWNMDPALLEDELKRADDAGRRPAAVLAVDILGQCADYAAICAICDKYGVPLVEDAAEALGATLHGRHAGGFGAFGAFSFNGNKIITTSGGGMLVTADGKLAERCRYLASQAKVPAEHYQHEEVGFNYRLSNLLAAIGRAQLQRLDNLVDRRRQIFANYQRQLEDLPGVEFMPEFAGSRSNRWLTAVLIDETKLRCSPLDLCRALSAVNIEARPVWKPMHRQPLYESARRRGGAVADQLCRRGLCLPSGSSLTAAQQQRVIDVVRATILSATKRRAG